MKKIIINVILAMLLTACASSGMMHETPEPVSRETAAKVTIHRSIPPGMLFDNLIFTIDGVDIYKFGKGDDFRFVLGEGNYIFGYKSGAWWFEKKCEVDVQIQPGENYTFNLEPGCVIDLL